jgi:WXXGXW repeat (2 copies)
MKHPVLKVILASAVAFAISSPSKAQIPTPPGLPRLEVRIAQDAPPRVRRERRTARPDRDSIWVGGYWDRQDTRWGWIPGRWDRPEVRSSRWVKPRYRRESGAYRFEPGHWSNQQVVEGEEYHQWKSQHGHDRRDRRDRRDRDRDGDSRP